MEMDETVGNFKSSGRRRRVLTAVAAVAVAGIATASIPAAYGSLAGHRPPAEAGARRGPTAYVATSAREVVPFNLRTHHMLKAIKLKVHGIPQAMVLAPDGRTLYVLSAPLPTRAKPVPSGGAITPIRTATDEAGRPIRLRGDLQQILITPNGQTAYVLDGGTGLIPVNLSTRRLLPEIKVRDAGGAAMMPSGKTIYVTADRGIVPVDLSTGTALKPIAISKLMMLDSAPVITPNGATLYYDVAWRQAADRPFRPGLLPVSTVTNTALKLITMKNFGGFQLAFGAGGATLYTAGNISVLPVETATNKPLKLINLPHSSDTYILSSNSDASAVYAADNNATFSKSWVVPINAATNTAGTPVSLGLAGWGPSIMAVAPDGSAWVGSDRISEYSGPGMLTVISPGSKTAGKNIRLSGVPTEIVFVP
jgi:DNA-binding beta-propeller fold protein YncE